MCIFSYIIFSKIQTTKGITQYLIYFSHQLIELCNLYPYFTDCFPILTDYGFKLIVV